MRTEKWTSATLVPDVGWIFAPAASAAFGFESGAVFAVNHFCPRSFVALTVVGVLVVVGLCLSVVGRRTKGWLRDVALGVGVGGLAASVIGLVTAGGAS